MTVVTQPRPRSWTSTIIDADVHAVVPSVDALRPYLDPWWLEFIEETGFTAPPWMYGIYPPGVETTVAGPWRGADGGHAASSVELLREQLLDPTGAEYALLSCYWGTEGIRHPDFAAGLARAVNDWVIAEWLERDSRLRASIVVPGFVPGDAAAEVERIGSHPGVVQVLLPVRATRLYGHRTWHPLFAAMERHDLVAGVHYGGVPDAPGPSGAESFFLEDYVAGQVGTFQAQLVSMVAEGLFHRFPGLRVSFLESGFSWLFSTLWRMDREWPALRRDVPWLTEAPSRTVLRHVKFAAQPIDLGPIEHFRRAVEWLGSDELLMFASDFPHGHVHNAQVLLDVLPESAHSKLMSENARTQYRL